MKLRVKHKRGNFFTGVFAACVPKICGYNCKVFNRSKYEHLRGLDLSDSFDGKSPDVPVGILVGQDFYDDFFTGKVQKGKYDPTAPESVVGWDLSDKVKAVLSNEEDSFCFHVLRCDVSEFETNIVHNGSRYEVKLPFKPDHDTLPDNFSTAKKRLESLNRKFGDTELLDLIASLREFQKVRFQQMLQKVHYLPHRPVVKPERERQRRLQQFLMRLVE